MQTRNQTTDAGVGRTKAEQCFQVDHFKTQDGRRIRFGKKWKHRFWEFYILQFPKRTRLLINQKNYFLKLDMSNQPKDTYIPTGYIHDFFYFYTQFTNTLTYLVAYIINYW